MEPGHVTPEVTTVELRQLLADRSAYVFDARPYLEYAIGHIPGSLTAASRAGAVMSLAGMAIAEIERIIPDKTAPLVLYGNGPFCDQCRCLTEELLIAGFTNVRRYQLGIPTWRALVGLTQIELVGAQYIFANDKTAVWVDARSTEEFAAGTLPGAVNMTSREDVVKWKDEQRLPLQDHNTRLIVFGINGEQARAVAAAIARRAFHNVCYFNGAVEELIEGIQQ